MEETDNKQVNVLQKLNWQIKLEKYACVYIKYFKIKLDFSYSIQIIMLREMPVNFEILLIRNFLGFYYMKYHLLKKYIFQKPNNVSVYIHSFQLFGTKRNSSQVSKYI